MTKRSASGHWQGGDPSNMSCSGAHLEIFYDDDFLPIFSKIYGSNIVCAEPSRAATDIFSLIFLFSDLALVWFLFLTQKNLGGMFCRNFSEIIWNLIMSFPIFCYVVGIFHIKNHSIWALGEQHCVSFFNFFFQINM